MATSNEINPDTQLRIALSAAPGGRLDGAWWPRSTDLEVELADLVDHFPTTAGHIDRVVYSRPDWSTSPHKVKVGRGTMKAGSFPRDDTHLMLLRLSSMVQLDLLVIPPQTESGAAQGLMDSATAPGNLSTGSELLVASAQAK
jgi:Family of unknown function (DUF5994)